MKDTHIGFLLEECKEYPELYNKIASMLWVQFDIRSAEITLLCTYVAKEILKND